MDGLIIIRSGWNMLVCLDMARQVVTGNDSTGAFLKTIKPTVSISIANEQNYYEFKPISFLFPGK